jgi:hypothetical protein
MTPGRAGFVLIGIVLLCTVAGAPPAIAAQKTVTETAFTPTDPAYLLIFNPCARGGQGEWIRIVGGTATVTRDERGNLLKVAYRAVVGRGSTTGTEYAIDLNERHPYTRDGVNEYRSRLVVRGGGGVFIQSYEATADGTTHTETCRCTSRQRPPSH